MQRESTVLFLTYQIEAMEEATKDVSRKEICDSLVYIFSKILQNEKITPDEEIITLRDWEIFCKSTHSQKFWILIDDLYRNLLKWSKTQKGKSKYSIFRLMAMIVGISQNSTRDAFVDPLIRSILSQFKGLELCIILNDFLTNLKFSIINNSNNSSTNSSSSNNNSTNPDDDNNNNNNSTSSTSNTIINNKINVPESFQIPIELIIDSLIQINESLSEEMTDHLISIGIELGKINIYHAIKIVESYLLKDDLTIRFIGVSILRNISQIFIEEFGEEIDCSSLYSNLLKCISGSETIVAQRDKELTQLEEEKQKKLQKQKHSMIIVISEDEKPQSDLNEILLTAALGCFPFIDTEPSKHLSLLEKISEYSISPVYSIAESALFTERDYILINPGSHLIYGLSLLLKQTIDYIQTNENYLKRIFYNTSMLLYYFNQAIENDFGVDGLNYEKFVLIRNQWEGTLLVWLCNSNDCFHHIAWRLLEQLSSPQIRQLELNSTNNKQIPHLIDNLPRPSLRNSSASTLVPLLYDFFENQYDYFYLCVNWAWSNLYRIITPIFLNIKSNSKCYLSDKEYYFHFLCTAPRCAPENSSFEKKHRFLTTSAITRWFCYISVAIKEHYFDRNQLLKTLKNIHPSCIEILLSCIFTNDITIQNVTTFDLQLSAFDIEKNSLQESIFSNDSNIISLLYQILLNTNEKIFNSNEYKIKIYYKKLIQFWFSSRIGNLNKFSLGTKRDFLGIIYLSIHYSNNLKYWLPDIIQKDSHLNQIQFITKIIKKILPIPMFESQSTTTTTSTNSSNHLPVINSSSSSLNLQNQKSLHIAVDCTAIQVLTAICKIQPFSIGWEKWEDTCLCFCSRGIYLQEFTKELFSCYISKNPSRFQDIIHYCISSSPSISQTPPPLTEYVLSLPLLKSIIISLRNKYELFGKDHILSLFFLSLFFQCSFEIKLRKLAVELALIISGREFKLNDEIYKKLKLKLISKSNHENLDKQQQEQQHIDIKQLKSCNEQNTNDSQQQKQQKQQKQPPLARVSQSFKDSFDTVIISYPQFLFSKDYELSASHRDREVYLVLANRYCDAIAKSYPQLSRDILRNIIEFSNSISFSTDIEMMLYFMKPWISNFGSSIVDIQTSRWIIRALFELSYIYLHDESLTLCIRSLWKDLICGSEEELRLALDWIIGFCARELQKDIDSIDHDKIYVCSTAVFNLIHYGTNTLSQFAISFLLNHLRDFSVSNFYENQFYENIFSLPVVVPNNTTATNPSLRNSPYDEYRERAVLIILVPLVIGEKRIDYSKYLPLLLHHSFVVDQIPHDNLTSLHAGEDLIANLLLGMEMRPSLIPKNIKNQNQSEDNNDKDLSPSDQVLRLRKIRNNYFPDEAIRNLSQSDLNPFRSLNNNNDSSSSSSSSRNSSSNPESSSSSSSSSTTGKLKRRKIKIRSIDSFPLHIQTNKITRFVDLYETIQ